MKHDNIIDKSIETKQSLIKEAMKIRAKAIEELGPDTIDKLYYLIMGKFPNDKH
ncbi:hypothetical protein OAK17_00415 [Alphaproteobacteria bacterium]|nr:hypothetical protein [Alphaproteobacteria bacterium]